MHVCALFVYSAPCVLTYKVCAWPCLVHVILCMFHDYCHCEVWVNKDELRKKCPTITCHMQCEVLAITIFACLYVFYWFKRLFYICCNVDVQVLLGIYFMAACHKDSKSYITCIHYLLNHIMHVHVVQVYVFIAWWTFHNCMSFACYMYVLHLEA